MAAPNNRVPAIVRFQPLWRRRVVKMFLFEFYHIFEAPPQKSAAWKIHGWRKKMLGGLAEFGNTDPPPAGEVFYR